jgi:hypothetical protein
MSVIVKEGSFLELLYYDVSKPVLLVTCFECEQNFQLDRVIADDFLIREKPNTGGIILYEQLVITP